MPHAKRTTKHRTPTKTRLAKAKPIKAPKRAKLTRIRRAPELNPFNLSATETARRKLRALIENGLYKPKSRKLTKYRQKKVTQLFNHAQSHGFIRGAKLIRPFKQTRKGYSLNKGFRVLHGKNVDKIPNALKTKTGAILPRDLAGRVTTLKDGTIRYRAMRNGRKVTVYSGTLNGKQTIQFLEKIRKHEFTMPKGKIGRILIFGQDNDNAAHVFDSGDALLAILNGLYGNGMRGLMQRMKQATRKHPNFGPITLEFFNAP